MNSLFNWWFNTLVYSVFQAFICWLILFVKVKLIAALKFKTSLLPLSLSIFNLWEFQRILSEVNYFLEFNNLWQEFSIVKRAFLFINDTIAGKIRRVWLLTSLRFHFNLLRILFHSILSYVCFWRIHCWRVL